MKLLASWFFTFFLSASLCAQGGFVFEGNKMHATLPFQLVNNLIIIPLIVNGAKLNFLLDTGVSETLIFSLDEAKDVIFSESQAVKMKGFGIKEDFTAYKCKNNSISFKNYADKNHIIYLVLDQEINISSQVGITVNGIIGYHFFKNNLVKINFESKKISVFKPSLKELIKLEKTYKKVVIEVENFKPYCTALVNFEQQLQPMSAKVLIDTGNSDALWLFKETDNRIEVPTLQITDYLGRGLNGDVFGKRGRVKSLQISDFILPKPIVSFPDSLHTNSISLAKDRVGSIGSEMIKRFNVIFDYQSSVLYLKKNNLFRNPFDLNKSGIEVHHQGLQWTTEAFEISPALAPIIIGSNNDRDVNNFHHTLKYKFELKPIFVISQVRKGSQAEKIGILKEDVLVYINNELASNFTLQEITNLLKGDENRTINLQIERKGVLKNFSFQLKSIL